MNSLDLTRLLAERPLALDQTALFGLAELARKRVSDVDTARATFAARGMSATTPNVRHTNRIAFIPLSGLIINDPFFAWLTGGTTPDAFAAAINDAALDSAVTRIVILVHSPGGGVELIQETAAAIRAARQRKPITAIVRTMAASAAFWLAAQADDVIATPSADVGSVGVFAVHYDASSFNEKLGIVPTYIASSPEKVEDNSAAPLGRDAKAFLQARVNAVRDQFVADLARGRNVPEHVVRKDFGEGRMYSATEALRRGMVDRIETLEVLIARVASGAPVVRAMRAARMRAQLDADLIATTLALTNVGHDLSCRSRTAL